MYWVLAAIGAYFTYKCIDTGFRNMSQNDRYSEAQRDRIRRLSQRGDFPHESYE